MIKLSPKKTVEGFVGGAVGTMLAAVALTNFLSQYQWMYCPRRHLEFHSLHCQKPDAFIPVQYQMTDLWEVRTANAILQVAGPTSPRNSVPKQCPKKFQHH